MKSLFLIFFSFFLCVLKAQIPTVGLTASWPFHGNANDSTGNSNNGTVHGATLTFDRFGNCNEAYKFDGINDYISVPNSPTINMFNTDFSISLWIKTAKNDTNGMAICKNQYGSWSGYFIQTNSNNGGYCTGYRHAFFYVAAGATQDACSDNGLDTNWHHFAGVYNHTINKGYFYVDGIQQLDIGQASGPTNNGDNLAFGAHNIGSTMFFTGVLDAIRIYQRALTPAEVIQLYNEPNPGSAGGSSFVKDTSICTAGSIVLSAGAATSYTWSTGNTSQTITVNSAGTYWVQTQSPCMQTDTFHVIVITPPPINILKDTSLCSNVYVLNASSSGATSYNWSTGSTNSSITTSTSGIYWVDMHKSQCIYRDSAKITLWSFPTINISDTVSCTSPVILNVNDPTLLVNWSTGSTTQTVSINSSGAYSVQVQNQNGCKQTVNFNVTIVNTSAYNILKDTSFCSNAITTLNVSSSGAQSYNWSTGSTNYSVTPTASGIYWVDMHISQCLVRDSAQITLVNSPVLNLRDTIICKEPIILNITDTTLFVTWWNGSHSNQISVNSAGTYSVLATKNGCVTSSTITVKNVEAAGNYIAPNIITPNGDGINDFFEFNTSSFYVKEFSIYNRWGRLVYTATNNSVKWNGKEGNEIVDDDTYFWVGIFSNPCSATKQESKQKGFFTVLK